MPHMSNLNWLSVICCLILVIMVLSFLMNKKIALKNF